MVTESTGGGRSRNGVVRHLGSLNDGVVQCGPFALTDKLTTTMMLINSLAFRYAVAVCDSSLRPPRRGSGRNQFAPAGGGSASRDTPAWDLDVTQGQPLQPAQFMDAAQALPSKAARDRALAVIKFSSGLSGSAGESLSRVAMFIHGFPAPVLQQQFSLRDGREAFVDFWFEEQRLAGEFDGQGKYLRDDWGAGLSIQQRVMAEKQREDQIRAQGVGFVRWVWDEMMDANDSKGCCARPACRNGSSRTRNATVSAICARFQFTRTVNKAQLPRLGAATGSGRGNRRLNNNSGIRNGCRCCLFGRGDRI
ncbi:MAG: hypothetical protein WBX27_05560 [Specibacter sp.]